MNEEVTQINQQEYGEAYKGSFLHWMFRRCVETTNYQKNKFNRAILRKHQLTRGSISVFEIGFGYGNLLTSFSKEACINGSEISASAINNLITYGLLTGRKIGRFFHNSNIFESTLGLKYDLIIMSHVLEHLPDDVKALEWCKEHLRPNGKILINIPINEPAGYDPKHFRLYSSDQFLKLLDQLGLFTLDLLMVDKLSQVVVSSLRGLPSFVRRVFGLFVRLCPPRFQILLEKLIFVRRCQPSQFLVLTMPRQ